MSATHGLNIDVCVGGYPLEGYLTSLTVGRTAEVAETSTLGSTAKSYAVGLQDATLSADGIWDGTATSGVDARLSTLLGAAATPVSAAWAGLTTHANVAVVTNAGATKYEITGDTGSAVAVSLEMQPTGGAWNGYVVRELAAHTTTSQPDGTNAVDTGITDSVGWVANLHVTAVSGSTPSLTVQLWECDSQNGSYSAVTGGAFTATGVVGSQQLTGTESLQEWIAAKIIITGGSPSFTLLVTFAKRYS